MISVNIQMRFSRVVARFSCGKRRGASDARDAPAATGAVDSRTPLFTFRLGGLYTRVYVYIYVVKVAFYMSCARIGWIGRPC